jgi:hypothetical protein
MVPDARSEDRRVHGKQRGLEARRDESFRKETLKDEEIRASSLQFVRNDQRFTKPSKANEAASDVEGDLAPPCERDPRHAGFRLLR